MQLDFSLSFTDVGGYFALHFDGDFEGFGSGLADSFDSDFDSDFDSAFADGFADGVADGVATDFADETFSRATFGLAGELEAERATVVIAPVARSASTTKAIVRLGVFINAP
ncbi:unannotated protein [freshwater metagenome]|uniref:Unannotated protein n=1 Tax=freshwater metagenome TaxID=449393 RepID=A0A6J7XXX4_9ZZZZ|nr:hypothetical protein [Actinomycetota bacterium]